MTMFSDYVNASLARIIKGKTPEDLESRILALGVDQELQFNVFADGGEPIPGKPGFTDGINSWFNRRIPRNASKDPYFEDFEMRYPEADHWSEIGSSGWNWRNRESHWVGFDVDSITGHAPGVGISDDEMGEFLEHVKRLPYVEVRHSTSGRGIHLYVLLDRIPTRTHTEHAAVARAVLSMMSTEAGYDFARCIDVCGAILWFYSRRMDPDRGFALIKPPKQTLTESDLPANWRDHTEVVTRRRAKVCVPAAEQGENFEALTRAQVTHPLEMEHKHFIEKLMETGYATTWVHDHGLLQTHTVAIAQVHKELGLKGVFRTNSPGTDPAHPNCFLFPLPDGEWRAFRFGLGTSEDPSWEQGSDKWTQCSVNAEPTLDTLIRTHDGRKLLKREQWGFTEAQNMIAALTEGGVTLDMDPFFRAREAKLKKKDGVVFAEIRKQPHDPRPGPNWMDGHGWWSCAIETTLPRESVIQDATADDNVRCVETLEGVSLGWFVRKVNKQFKRVKHYEIRPYLKAAGHEPNMLDSIVGNCLHNPWTAVNLPFQPEYPGGRQWNRHAPQLAVVPEPSKNPDNPHPTWDRVLDHCFSDLDDVLRQTKWGREHGINSGREYGYLWIASCIREPFEPLPFLFFYGEQNCGKSILHESLNLLITDNGVVSAAYALTNNSGFNGSLGKAVIAYVEEQDISKQKEAYNRIKEWTTAKRLAVRKMYHEVYHQPNCLHFMMMANHQRYCPVFEGDTRIMVMRVPPLKEGQLIPKLKLLQKLKEEAPYILHTLLNRPIPESEGRLRLPVIETSQKATSIDLHRNNLELFIKEKCFNAPGERVLFKDFYQAFKEYLDSQSSMEQWSKVRVSRMLPQKYPSGTMEGNKKYIGNLSLQPPNPNAEKKPYMLDGSRLIRE